MLMAAAACGDDGSSDEDEPEDDPPATTTTTQPSATDDEEAAFEIVRDLDATVNELIEWLYEDPSAVEDPDDINLERFMDLTTEDGGTRESVLEELERYRELEQSVVAASPGVFSDRVVYNLVSDGPDVVRYKTCTTQDREIVDADGNRVGPALTRRIESTVEARRVDGTWRYHDGIAERGAEIEPDSGRVGDCERVLEENPQIRDRMPEALDADGPSDVEDDEQ